MGESTITEDAGSPEPGNDPAATLAAEYVQRRIAGKEASMEWYLEKLRDATERTRFRKLVVGAERVDGLLPRQVREGRILSDRYRIEGELGAGGMGKVFAAQDLKLKRRVAVKVLGALDSDDLDLGSLFKRESELLASLQHPGIVAIHEAARDGDVQYFVMELVEGVSLNRLIERLAEKGQGGPRTPHSGEDLRAVLNLKVPEGGRDLLRDEPYPRTVARIMVELTRTLEAAHAKGVIHRDLKPGNVMLQGDGMPVVLDFGLGGNLQQETGDLTRRLFGSAAYLAPEQAESGEVGADVRADVYQMGLLLYELLTLRRAFPGEDLSAVLRAVGRGDFIKPRRHRRDIPRDLEAICLKAMELYPARRYASAAEFRTDLERFLSGEARPKAVSGGAVQLLFRDGRYLLRRHRVAAAVACALVVGLLAGTIFLRGGSSDATRMRPITWVEGAAGFKVKPACIHQHEFLGVEVETREPRWIYAYAVFGPKDDRYRFVAPVRPYEGQGKKPPFPRYVESGPARILYSYATTEMEGLVVFALEERHELLEQWLESMESECAEPNPDRGITLAKARRYLDELRNARGGAAPPDLHVRPGDLKRSLDAEGRSGPVLPFSELGPREFFLQLAD
ncbi:MAG: serine/threonine-protein kinase [Planctomycetota bacterium]